MSNKYVCEFIKRGQINCDKNANYILHIDNKKYCSIHLLSTFNAEKLKEDPEFIKCKKLADIDSYTKIDYKATKVKSINDDAENNNPIQCIFVTSNACKFKGKQLYIHNETNDIVCKTHLLEKINDVLDTPKTSLRECKGLYKLYKVESKDTKESNNEDVIQTIMETLNKKTTIFECKELLGKGAFGSVYHIIHLPTSISYALKIATYNTSNKKNSKRSMDMIYSEYSSLNKLHSRKPQESSVNIVEMIDNRITKPYVYEKEKYAYIIVNKYYKTLYDVVINSIGINEIPDGAMNEDGDIILDGSHAESAIVITDTWIRSIGTQLLSIIEHVHKKGMLYIDLKPENIMFKDDTLKEIVLIDFGIYKTWQCHRNGVRECIDVNDVEGTPLYASKNALSSKSTSRIDDIESIGYILIFLYNKGNIPWKNEKTNKSILNRKSNICYSSDGENLPEYIIDFIERTQNYHFQELPEYKIFKYILCLPDFITSLPILLYKQNYIEDDEETKEEESVNDICVICRMNFINGDEIRKLPCTHIYHRKCIDKWLMGKRSCPTCKHTI